RSEMSGFTQKTVAFVGTGTTAQARVVPGSAEQLHHEAIVKAVANAGLELKDIDGFVSTFTSDPYHMGEMLGINEKTFAFNNQNACVATRHMAEFGTTEAQIASVSVAQRYNASLNPEAVYRTRVSVDDVLNSRMISSPFTMLMCAAVNDGAAALIMTTAERAR